MANTKKAEVFALTMKGSSSTCIFFSDDCLKDVIEMHVVEELETGSPITITVEKREMTEKEIDELPEFDGF